MAEEKKTETKKKPAKKGNMPPINSNVVFFAILVIGIIIFATILLLKPTKTIYRTNLAQNAEVIVQLGKKDIDIGIKVDGEVVSQEHGTYEKRQLEEGEKPQSETAVEYVIIFDNNSDNASMVIDGNELTLYLADDTVLVCIADKTDETTAKIEDKKNG